MCGGGLAHCQQEGGLPCLSGKTRLARAPWLALTSLLLRRRSLASLRWCEQAARWGRFICVAACDPLRECAEFAARLRAGYLPRCKPPPILR